MLKFLFKTTALGALGAAAVYASGGTERIMDWVHDKKQIVEEKISEMQGMSAELSKIERKVSDLDREIQNLKQSKFQGEHEIQKLEEDIGDREETLRILKTNLEKAQGLLQGDAQFYKIGLATYARGEVETDVAEKIRLYKVQEETLANLRQTYVTHKNAYAMADENVRRGESLRTELQARVRLLRAKLEKYKAREIYAETVAMDFDAQEFNTAMGETRKLFAEFEEKLVVKNRMLDERLKIKDSTHALGINYDNPETRPYDVRLELGDLLGKTSSGASTSPVMALTERK